MTTGLICNPSFDPLMVNLPTYYEEVDRHSY